LETWHIANEDSLIGLRREGRGRSALVSSECGTLQTRAHLLKRRKREEGRAG
jgi:hypothetical protein